jgi:hypothetical protein
MTTSSDWRALAKSVNFGVLYGSSRKSVVRSLNQEKGFKTGDHVVLTTDTPCKRSGDAWGVVVDATLTDRVMIDWDNDFDNLVLGHGPFWHKDLELESALDRFAREATDERRSD